ncbi:MAG: hypothetical protein JSV86_04945 [Gemmatimonadota bacterium]|nr:MAG: hypothetical protein JSV86_04945 [Gemmatimonadota bacterium]
MSKKAERDEFLVNRWVNCYLPAAIKAKKRFQSDADEVDKYFRSDHEHFYDEINGMLPKRGLFTMTINLAAQIRGYIGPHLYARHPTRTVTANTTDTVSQWFAKVADEYLNAVPYEVKLKEEIRDAIDDSLLAGRGVLLVEKDREKDVVTTKHVPVDDLLIDPDARCLGDAQWIAIRYCEPLHLVKKRYKTGGPDDPTIGLKANATSQSDSLARIDKDAGKLLNLGDARFKGQTTDQVVYYKVWSKMGSGLLYGKAGPNEKDVEFTREKGNRFRFMVIVPNHHRPLLEGEWPIPMHLDDDWPIGLLDFTPVRKGDKTDPLWPVSLMKLGLPQQKAIDLLSTILINDLKFKSRIIAGVLGEKSEDVKEALTAGDLHTAISLDPADGVTDIRQILQIMQLGEVNPILLQEIQYQESKFGEITGLLPLLKGVTIGHGDAQMRSAMEASVRDRNSRSRIEDMNERVETVNTDAARREFLGMRLSMSPDEVGAVVNDKLPQAPWKVKVSIGTDPMTVYDARKQIPLAGVYYPNQEIAQQALQAIRQQEPEIRLAWEIANPGETFFLATSVVQVTLKELWFDTSGLTADRMVREYKVVIESGSSRRQDESLKRDQANFMLAEVGQRSAALGLWDTYNQALDRFQQVMQVPRHERIYFPAQQLQQRQQQMLQQQSEQMQQDATRKAQLEIAKQDVKERGRAQQIVLKGQVDSALQNERLAWERAIDAPGGGGWR